MIRSIVDSIISSIIFSSSYYY